MIRRDMVIDVETESLEDIRLGAYSYCIHPSTDVLCVSWRPLDDPPGTERVWFPGLRLNPSFLLWKFVNEVLGRESGPNPPVFLPGDTSMPVELRESLARGDRWWAHNAFFERCWYDQVMIPRYGWHRVPDDTWWCSAALAAYYGYSQNLERAGIGVGTRMTKDTIGRSLMMRMSPINKRTRAVLAEWPQNLYRLGEYCKTDVSSEAELIRSLPPMPAAERATWLLDQRLNLRGLPLDRELVVAGAASSALIQRDARRRLPALTGGAVTTPGQVGRIREYVEQRTGRRLPDLQAVTVAQLLLDDEIPNDVREVLRIRQDAGTAAIKKFAKESAAISHDPSARFRGGFVYYGAHTGRWTGRVVQPTNMPRAHFSGEDETEAGITAIKSGDLDQMIDADRASLDAARARAADAGRDFATWRPSATETLTKCVRASITAPEGRTFVAADWAGIELRVLTWFARDSAGLRRIVEHGSSQLYLDMAEAVFGQQVTKADTFRYTVGKAGRLGCGYGMGPYARDRVAGRWVARIDDHGRPYGGFVEYARAYGIEITHATLRLAERVVSVYRDTNQEVAQLWYRCHNAVVSVAESGYPEEINGVKFSRCRGALVLGLPSGRELFYPRIRVEERKGRKSLSYMGDKNKKWQRLHLYGGLIVENIVQAMSRDILVPAMHRVSERYDIVSHCYDEIVSEVMIGQEPECAAYMDAAMCDPLHWCPDLPLETEIWTGKRYRK